MTYFEKRAPKLVALRAAGNDEFTCQFYADHWDELAPETKLRLVNFRPDIVKELDQ